MADVYDFRTGKLCKCCDVCEYWNELSQFPLAKNGKYGVGDTCHSCLSKERPKENLVFTFEMDVSDESASDEGLREQLGPDDEVA